MFNKNAATAICKMFEFVEQIASEFERADFRVEKSSKLDPQVFSG
jgi:hypothetical protein